MPLHLTQKNTDISTQKHLRFLMNKTMSHIENVFIDEFYFDSPVKPDYKEVMSWFSSSHEQECCEDHWLDFDAVEEPFKEVTRRLEYINHIEIKGTP